MRFCFFLLASAFCIWSICVAPVRGGSYFLCLPQRKQLYCRSSFEVSRDHDFGGIQGMSSRIMALSRVSSLRMPATKATLVFFPLFRRRAQNALISGLAF